MSGGIYSIGLGGLAAAQAGLVTTGHNIANANTQGYHRQSIVQSAYTPLFTGAGFLGQGVQVDTVRRAYDQFLEVQLAQSQSQASYYSTYYTQLTQIDNVVASGASGVSSALQDFFSAVHGVASQPASLPARQSMQSAGEALTARFNALTSRFDEIRNSINGQLASSVTEVNALAREIAQLNGRILTVQQNPLQPPNDLLDQRDALVGRLNELVGATVVTQSNGALNVVIGNGQNLVVGDQALSLTTTPSAEDPLRLDVAYLSGGNAIPLGAGSLNGGSIGALLTFRATDLDAAQNALGRVALGLAQTFNDQHRLGQDLNGAAGGNFFVAPAVGVISKSSNTGNAVIGASVASASALTTSDYRLTYTGANYTLTRLSDNTITTYATLPQTVDGVTIALASGAAASGDSFLIQPTRNAARDIAMNLTDPAAIAAAAPIRTLAAGANTGGATISAGTVNGPPPVNGNLQQPVTITFTGAGTFDVTGTGTGNPTGVAYSAGGNITYNGWTVRITGTPAAGDVFTIGPNSGGVADGRNVLALAQLQTQTTLAGGTTSYQGAYGQMVSAVGNRTAQMDVASQAQVKLVSEANAVQQALSGVNLDEEAANLLRYQQAYQASGKMIQIAATLFETVLELR
jgi:flagellar hook-associated protein 1 FlgK